MGRLFTSGLNCYVPGRLIGGDMQIEILGAIKFGAPNNYGPCAIAQAALPLARACFSADDKFTPIFI
jgi:hypothetical protein